MSLANVSIVGNLVRSPEQMCFPSGTVKTTMVVAVNSPPKPGRSQNADFYSVEAWGKLAELSNKYLQKGNQVTVTGRLVLDHWTDRHGKDRVTPIVEAAQLALPPRAKVASDGAGEDFSTNPISGEVVMAADDEDFDGDDYEEISSEGDLERSDQESAPSTKIRAEPRRSKQAVRT
jgi:single-strand DNA-binding protein